MCLTLHARGPAGPCGNLTLGKHLVEPAALRVFEPRAVHRCEIIRIFCGLCCASPRQRQPETVHEMTTEPRNLNLSPVGSRLAKRSCQSCKLRKRKCTRELPECRLCIRWGPVWYASMETASANLRCAVDVDHALTNLYIILRTNSSILILRPISAP